MTELLQQVINGVALGSMYALLALGVTIVWGVLDVMNFAHGQLLTWGTFAAAASLGAGVPTVVAVIFAMLVAAVLAVLLERLIISPLKARAGVGEFGFVVATIGVSLIMLTIIKMWTNSEVRSFPSDAFPTGNLTLGNLLIPRLQVLLLATMAVVMIGLFWWLKRTSAGRALRAVAFSKESAQLLGVNAGAVFVIAFAISGVLAALAGIFIAAQTNQISYSTGDTLLVLAFAAVVLGGMGSIAGALCGGLVLGVGEVLLAAYVSAEWQSVFPFLLMTVVLVVRPAGLFSSKEVSRA